MIKLKKEKCNCEKSNQKVCAGGSFVVLPKEREIPLYRRTNKE